jgi:enoyl-CoA hydratase
MTKVYLLYLLITAAPAYEYLKVEKTGLKQNVGLITLNRPKALNALCAQLMHEMSRAIEQFDNDEAVGVVVITGNEKAFAAGADIKEMSGNSYAQNVTTRFLDHWNSLAKARKPTIAAVNGYAVRGFSNFGPEAIDSL